MTRGILLVDDHVAVRMGLEEILLAAIPGLEFGAAADYAEALRLALEQTWHLVIVDLDLPGGRSGLDLITSLHDAGCWAPVLVYTLHLEDQFGIRALKAGALGYLSKAAPIGELVTAVRTLLAGNRYISSALAGAMAEHLVRKAPESPHDLLSKREFEVFRALALGHPIVQIASELQLSPKTVSTYRSRVLEKLNLKSTSDLIRYAIAHALVK
jgi:DNA-binding NarL/FixJ family response regulator